MQLSLTCHTDADLVGWWDRILAIAMKARAQKKGLLVDLGGERLREIFCRFKREGDWK